MRVSNSALFGNFFKTKILNTRCFLDKSPTCIFRLFSVTMASKNKARSSVENLLMPPSRVYGMKHLYREAFTKEIEVPTLDVPVGHLKAALKFLKPCLLKMHELPPVQGDDKVKKIFLNPVLFDAKLPYFEEMLKKLDINNVLQTKLILTYENFSHESIFKAVLPSDTAGNVSSFSIVGHIIHLNLKPELNSYKSFIGQVFLDKFYNIKTVVNKAQTIDKEFRNFEMELIAGEPIYEVTVRENGFQYAFDFSKVFWNPRLVSEHSEIVEKAASGDVVFDVFAGVGPFSIPMAKMFCQVIANDLNPDSYKWLCHNAKLNKVSDFLTAYNLDGREFIQTVLRSKLIELWNEDREQSYYIHIIMNLPACALEFLSSFDNLLKDVKYSKAIKPHVYCYFFLKKGEEPTDVLKNYLSEDLLKSAEISFVRLVAPNKKMMRLTYQIPSSVLLGNTEDSHFESDAKRIKLSDGSG